MAAVCRRRSSPKPTPSAPVSAEATTIPSTRRNVSPENTCTGTDLALSSSAANIHANAADASARDAPASAEAASFAPATLIRTGATRSVWLIVP